MDEARPGEAETFRLLEEVRAGDRRALDRLLTGHRAIVRVLAFTPDGRTLASGSADWLVRWWDAGTGEEVEVRAGLAAGERVIAAGGYALPDGTEVAIVDGGAP